MAINGGGVAASDQVSAFINREIAGFQLLGNPNWYLVNSADGNQNSFAYSSLSNVYFVNPETGQHTGELCLQGKDRDRVQCVVYHPTDPYRLLVCLEGSMIIFDVKENGTIIDHHKFNTVKTVRIRFYFVLRAFFTWVYILSRLFQTFLSTEKWQ